MKRKRIFHIIIVSVILVTVIVFGSYGERQVPAVAAEETISGYASFAPGVTAEMYYSEFWTNSLQDLDAVIKSEKEIKQLNHTILMSSEKLANNLWNELQYSETQISGLKYGICVKRTNIKSEPVLEPVWENPADPYFDRYQLTTARINTPVLIDEETEDGMFYHVIMYDYEGWALSEDIAVCANREEWLRAQEMESALVVLSPRIYLEINKELLTMGTRLRLLTKEEAREQFAEGGTWGCYTVEVPVRAADGSYNVRYDTISITEKVSVGYLPLTTENLLEQAFLFLGNRYGWGGMYESVDCSGMVQEVMACFGINMPRDAEEQIRIPASRITFTPDMTEEERKGVLDLLTPGTLLYFSGHIMFYLGEKNGEYFVISSVSSMRMPGSGADEDLLKVRRVVINSLSMERKSGATWLNELQYAVYL